MSMYFDGITTVAGATRRWRALAKKHHPDVAGGDPDRMAAINGEYREILARLRSKEPRTPDLHETYQAPQREEPVTPEQSNPPRIGGLADLLSDDEITDVADAIADTASKLVNIGVRAFARRIKARRGTH